MITSQSSYIQWCNENEARSYPLSDEATRLDNSGQLLPNDIVVDLGIIVPPAYQDVYCSSIRVTPNVYSICLRSANNALLIGTYAASSYTPYTVVPLTPLIPDVSGWVVFGSHRLVLNEFYVFDAVAQSRIVSRAIRVVDSLPVHRFYKDGNTSNRYVDKIVKLVGGGLITLRRDPSAPQQIYAELDKQQSQRFLGPCDHYADAGQCRATPVRRINGVEADPSGTLTLHFMPGAL